MEKPFQKYVASLFQQHEKIFETLIWKCITFKPRLRTFQALRIVTDLPAYGALQNGDGE